MIKLLCEQERTKRVSGAKLTSVRQTFPLHTHDFFEFFLVTKGRAIHVVNNVAQVIERGSLVFVRPSDEHCYDYYKTQDFEFYNHGFETEIFDKINMVYDTKADALVNRSVPKHIKVNLAQLHFLEQRFEELLKIPTCEQRRLPLSYLAMEVIYLMLTTEDFDQNHLPPDWLIKVLDEMSEPENFIVGLPRLLELCNYSQEHINREFKRYLNITPTKYINELRLQYANDLLEKGDQEIVDVCENCGFHNLSHFYSEFKKYYGFSPNKARKNSENSCQNHTIIV
ncbi:AraC family transcriptional regulator [Paludicola sp. MB14-C6]|uniref:helix-turn-helix transcriptional regulator n=1 Tax=Paludihabitans sp. MB14-C6 TaxID=3070656 RepID=UPI0027DACA7B|nr:AraC family transcriptional regulator [Paludicola sp. MB14-C6]WMJ22573.1 AraC family transcriptional regulator [Paludicola sp. MB14-C6]